MTVKFHFGDVVRKMRTAKKPVWSQEHLAKLSGVDVGVIGRMERGEDYMTSAQGLIAQAFEVPLWKMHQATTTDGVVTDEGNGGNGNIAAAG